MTYVKDSTSFTLAAEDLKPSIFRLRADNKTIRGVCLTNTNAKHKWKSLTYLQIIKNGFNNTLAKYAASHYYLSKKKKENNKNNGANSGEKRMNLQYRIEITQK